MSAALRHRQEGTDRISPEMLQTLLAVGHSLASSLELESVLQIAIESSCELLGLDTGAIYVLDHEDLYLGATTPPLDPEFPETLRRAYLRDHPHVAESLSTGEPVYVRDARIAALSPAERAVAEARDLCSILYLPLMLEERAVGVMIIGSVSDVQKFETEDRDLARMLAYQVTLAVANAHLFESVQRVNAEITRINDNLEHLVDERTKELACANEELEAQAEELLSQAAELEERTLELEEANEAKARFLRSMSHELRTPLNSILGFSGLLLQGLAGDINDEQRLQLEMINHSGKHLLAIMGDLLDLCRIDAGAVRLTHAPINVPALASECTSAVSPEAKDKGLSVTVDISDPAPRLVSDIVRVRQILLNLLGNAVKFTAKGSVTLLVEESPPNLITFTVRDTGPGIPEDRLEAIFGEFEQVLENRDRTIEGTGLGLAVSSGLAVLLGGTISATSEVGEGATFVLALPQEQDPAIEQELSI